MPDGTRMHKPVSDTAPPKSEESHTRHTAVQSTNAVKGTPTKAVKAKGHRIRHSRRIRKSRRRVRRRTHRR